VVDHANIYVVAGGQNRNFTAMAENLETFLNFVNRGCFHVCFAPQLNHQDVFTGSGVVSGLSG
jgi:hypothetical protein